MTKQDPKARARKMIQDGANTYRKIRERDPGWSPDYGLILLRRDGMTGDGTARSPYVLPGEE